MTPVRITSDQYEQLTTNQGWKNQEELSTEDTRTLTKDRSCLGATCSTALYSLAAPITCIVTSLITVPTSGWVLCGSLGETNYKSDLKDQGLSSREIQGRMQDHGDCQENVLDKMEEVCKWNCGLYYKLQPCSRTRKMCVQVIETEPESVSDSPVPILGQSWYGTLPSLAGK